MENDEDKKSAVVLDNNGFIGDDGTPSHYPIIMENRNLKQTTEEEEDPWANDEYKKSALDVDNVGFIGDDGTPSHHPVTMENRNLKQTKEEEEDPWVAALPDTDDQLEPWSELNTKGKCIRVIKLSWLYLCLPILFLGFLYMFICSLDFLSSAFRLLGGEAAGESGKYEHLFANSSLSDTNAGIIMLFASLFLLCFCLFAIIKILHTILRGKVARLIKKFINADFPGKLSFLTGYFAIVLGALLTFLVQSSSIFTSAITPLVGVGVITLERMYPLTLGANIGTTATAMIASLAATGNKLKPSIQVALCHLFFNITGILIFYPIPFMRKIPVSLAKKLGNTTAKYRWFALLYLLVMFFLLPAFVFGLSLWSIWALVGFGIPILLLSLFITIVNILQNKRPHWLPVKLQDWEFLPTWLHSLKPLDSIITKVMELLCKRCTCRQIEEKQEDVVMLKISTLSNENQNNDK
ncbi:sodium-dependent phosphate transport protein 2B-like [Anneissia japonica]|uniref:sodium-dependent phosphate transport protein 2B-like n=1 Tax=Anneissia japonica TaxID=1529436 RepID=UPI0014258786|nr:sodium-dependent phosphate transport protein 2B-like [Anneissia japonica]